MFIGCDDCGRIKMDTLMIHNELWNSIVENHKALLCPECIERRLGRPLTLHDLKPCGATCQLLLGAYVAQNTPGFANMPSDPMLNAYDYLDIKGRWKSHRDEKPSP